MNFFGAFFKSPWDDEQEYNSKNIFNLKNRKGDFFQNFNGKDFFSLNIIYIVLLVILTVWLGSGIYKVEEGEAALVLRFGKYSRTHTSGLHYHLPEPFESIVKEKIDKSRRLEIGYRSNQSRPTYFNKTQENDSSYKYLLEESTMLTGDENIVDLNCDIMWRIKDLKNYTFNIASPEDTVKVASESAVREVIGKTPILYVLSNQKQKISEDILELTQKILDSYESGIQIDNVQLLRAEPPSDVIDAYRDVQTSKANKEEEINQAYAYKNDIIPRARGEAAKMVQDAEGYKQEVISHAKGDSKRFLAVYAEYVDKKSITKERLYLDMLKEILSSSNKVIIGNGQVLPHMSIKNLDNINQ